MSLKYKVIKKKNTSYEGTRECSKQNFIELKNLRALRNFVIKYGNPGDLKASVDDRITDCKNQIKALVGELLKENFFIEIKSTKTWLMFEEYTHESGITRYRNMKEYKVDKTLPYDRSDFKNSVNKIKAESIKVIQEYRKKRKEIGFVEKKFNIPVLTDLGVETTYRVYCSGGFGNSNSNYNIHHEPGTFLKLKESIKLKTVFEDKKPRTNEHHVGVEIEFICKKNKFDLAKLLFDAGISDNLTLKNDGSLRNEEEYPYTHELCVLAPESTMADVMRKVITVLDDAGSKVNNRCGLHVHLDIRNRNKEVVFHNLVNAQNMLYSMNPRSRLDGTQSNGDADTAWSKKMVTDDFNAALAIVARSKYYGINNGTHERLKTIEVRIHSGSTNYAKIMNWITILTAIASTTVKHEGTKRTTHTFAERYNLSDAIVEYMNERIKKFNPNGNHVTIDEVA